jgi:hypothetical protein
LQDGRLRGSLLIPVVIKDTGFTSVLATRYSFLDAVDCKLARSGRYIASVNDGRLSLWSLDRHRPLSCWLTCGVLTLLAAWVGWPRKKRIEARVA